MSIRSNGLASVFVWAGLAVGLAAQTPQTPAQPAAPAQTPAPAQPTFRVQIDAVNMDVVVKDSDGRFVPDLKKEDFEIYEDGVKQDITSLTMSYGGRVTNVLEPPPAPVPEGILLPQRRVVNDTSGRIFLFFVDDLHLQFQQSGRVRQLFKQIAKLLVHDGDLFGIVSSGPSSISIDMTYDKRRLDEAVEKIHGDGLKPTEIIQAGSSLSELRHRSHVAFKTMLEALANLEKVTNRRKALVWVSEGYDFNPFQDSRYGLLGPNSSFVQNRGNVIANNLDPENPVSAGDPVTSQMKSGETFSDADLAWEISEVTRAANRANTTIYSIDPRGLVAGGDIDEQVDTAEFADHIRKTQDTLRILADDTGGLAVVNQNDFERALKRIDAESSDYYVLGYYSNNPDPLKRRRQIEVKIPGRDVEVFSRKEYVFRLPPPEVPTTR
jgi:VWFA-related protein